jgi:hypothetical protein
MHRALASSARDTVFLVVRRNRGAAGDSLGGAAAHPIFFPEQGVGKKEEGGKKNKKTKKKSENFDPEIVFQKYRVG